VRDEGAALPLATVLRVEDVFAGLAAQLGLEDRRGTSPEGLPERYLYSPDMAYRYGFGRWWGDQDLATTDLWVLLNPATGDTEQRRRPTLERCITRVTKPAVADC
jgi:hypothetical protein